MGVLSKNVLPAVFPPALFELLLTGLGSEQANTKFTLSDLALVSPAMARSLDRLLEYDGDDFVELFTLDWPRGGELSSENRATHVEGYVQWFFSERYLPQLRPLQEGFRSVVGVSNLLRSLVGATQLERILCGTEA